jgi:type I restriction-modification system DNA methylase subunit
MKNSHTDNIIKLIQKVSYRHQIWQVFSDFLELSAIAISNAVDRTHQEEREKQYMNSISRYEPKEIQIFPELYGELVLALEDELTGGGPVDVLGYVFHSLELHNKWTGQFFTPSHICEMMGQIALGDRDSVINERGYLTVSEPCAGSGAMVLGFAKAMQQKKYNYCSQMVVTAVDVDLKCVYMTYLQLSFYGIPAVVIHGDTILVKEYSRWLTPAYIWGGWWARQRCGMTVPAHGADTGEIIPEVQQKEISKPIEISARQKKQAKPEQLALIDLGEFKTNTKENVG